MKKQMKNNNKGFTLIELLAVIVILGILMIIAIPAVTKYINQSKKNTFIETAKSYVSAVRFAYLNDDLSCSNSDGKYYIKIDGTNMSQYLEKGGYSSWNNASITSFIYIDASASGTKYSYQGTDGTHGFDTMYDENYLTASNIKTTGAKEVTNPTEGYKLCSHN